MFPASFVCLEPRLLPSTGITRLRQYYEPLRDPKASGLSLAGVRLVILAPRHGVSRVATLSLCACCRHYPGTATGDVLRSMLHPLKKHHLCTAHAFNGQSRLTVLHSISGTQFATSPIQISMEKLYSNWQLVR